ncbi:glycosyltransferase [Pontibacter sp. G13]|uniref:glycosyltransferase n=1 Tax=Pontibacter sp. G13 TaxID=3074898 RepID=UPI00288BCBA2|nr:glycosyltransferase [Pontibacter sp. G13]WNJ20896.1 glycosyltransferase [Pontibacter sp. G13]
MKLLVLTSRFPYPIEKGDKLRIYHQIRTLSQNHKITLVSLSDHPVADSDLAEMQRWCEGVHVFRLRKGDIALNMLKGLLTGKPMMVSYFYRPHILRKVQQIASRVQPDHVLCQLVRMSEYAKAIDAPKTLDYMDNFSVGMARRAKRSGWLTKWLFDRESQLLAKYESDIFKVFDHATIISAQDRDLMPLSDQDQIAVIPNGIDTHFFQPRPETTPSHELVFVGNMGYFPNIQAAKYLAEEVMPRIWEVHPEVKLLLAGARPSSDVKALARNPKIEVSGWIDDIRDAYSDGRVFVAPLFTGQGQQNKILEAMAMGIPCITSPMVNEAIGATPGTEILLAATPNAFVEGAFDLIAHPEKAQKIGAKGCEYIRTHYSWEGAVQSLESVMGIHSPATPEPQQ